MITIIDGGAFDEQGNPIAPGLYEVVKKKRSSQLNKAFHKWLSMISEEANEKGLTLDLLFTKPQEMRITPNLLKDLFREYGVYMYHKDSTAKLTNKEFTKLIEVFEQVIAERLDCTIPFPSYERE